MPGRRAAALVAIAAALAAAAGGCGRGAAAPVVVTVAVQAPLTGPRADLGRAVLQGAGLAVEELRPAWRSRGVSLEVAAYDEADPRQGVANAELVAADLTVIGVVGHLDSDVAVPASERYEQAGVPVIALAVTAPEFTRRGLATAFRLLPPDDVQGRAAARFARETLKARAAFVVHDRTGYGQELADAFRAEAERSGLRVPAYRGLVEGSPLAELADEVKATGADLVFYAGDEEEGARLARALRREGVGVALLGGDSLDGPAFAALAGEAARGTYYVSLVPDPGALPQARAWAAAYRQRYGEEPHGLALLAYDAVRLLLAAAHRAGEGQGGAAPSERRRVAAALRGLRFTGLSGPIAFDERGDNAYAGGLGPRFFRVEDGYPGVRVPDAGGGAAPSPR